MRLAKNSSISHCRGEKAEQSSIEENNISSFYTEGEANQLISPVPSQLFSPEGDMEPVQHYVSVDARKCLEPGVAGERYKHCSMDRP